MRGAPATAAGALYRSLRQPHCCPAASRQACGLRRMQPARQGQLLEGLAMHQPPASSRKGGWCGRARSMPSAARRPLTCPVASSIPCSMREAWCLPAFGPPWQCELGACSSAALSSGLASPHPPPARNTMPRHLCCHCPTAGAAVALLVVSRLGTGVCVLPCRQLPASRAKPSDAAPPASLRAPEYLHTDDPSHTTCPCSSCLLSAEPCEMQCLSHAVGQGGPVITRRQPLQ